MKKLWSRGSAKLGWLAPADSFLNDLKMKTGTLNRIDAGLFLFLDKHVALSSRFRYLVMWDVHVLRTKPIFILFSRIKVDASKKEVGARLLAAVETSNFVDYIDRLLCVLRVCDRFWSVEKAIASDNESDSFVIFHVIILHVVQFGVMAFIDQEPSTSGNGLETRQKLAIKFEELFELMSSRLKKYACWEGDAVERQNEIK